VARLLDQDFARLETFLAGYTLAECLTSNSRKQIIKKGHKYCLTALQLWAIADQLAKTEVLIISSTTLKSASPQFDQLSECFSDITSSFFSAIHGLYKPANMSLRSAIETFTRSLAGLYSAEAASTTSIYRLFEVASGCEPFSGLAKPHYDLLHQQYSELCKYTHSVTLAHMVRSHAMSNFPKQEIEPMRVWSRHYEATIRSIASILLYANKALYLRASPQSQDVYEEVIQKEVRLFVLGAPS